MKLTLRNPFDFMPGPIRKAALKRIAAELQKIASEPTDVEYSADFCAGWDAAVSWIESDALDLRTK